MADIVHQMYGYFNGAYYTADEASNIVIPGISDITASFVRNEYLAETKEGKIELYNYVSDLATVVNSERVLNMKDFITGEKVTELQHLNNDYVVGVAFEIYNKDGKMIKSGEQSIIGVFSNALICSDIDSSDRLKYRKAFVIDGQLNIAMPQLYHYGIRNCCVQYPYTIKLTALKLYSTVGDSSSYESESDTQYCTTKTHGNSATYRHHCSCACQNDQIHTDFMSSFITNKVGTTLIDQLVVPAVLYDAEDYEQVTVASIDLTGSQYTFKFAEDIKDCIINMEILLDNFNEVYDKSVIDALLEENKKNDDSTDDTDTSDDTTDDTTDTTNATTDSDDSTVTEG